LRHDRQTVRGCGRCYPQIVHVDPAARLSEAVVRTLELSIRAGHVPGAKNVPWGEAVNPADGTFKSADELRELYAGVGIDGSKPVIVYCRIGERSSHTWFVLSEILGYPNVRNYDGSWTEWGNSVRVPIERSSEPGPDPRLKAVG
jgi:3-mercaptopyruvate sulfurtransferase SseA